MAIYNCHRDISLYTFINLAAAASSLSLMSDAIEWVGQMMILRSKKLIMLTMFLC